MRGARNEAGADDGCAGGDEIPRDSRWKIKGPTNFPTTKPCPGGCWDWHNYRNQVLNDCVGGGAIHGKWRELATPTGVIQHFERGSISWTPGGGAVSTC